nr:MAG TPA: hypothetical protein [Caudoviricetes sp.]
MYFCSSFTRFISFYFIRLKYFCPFIFKLFFVDI